ncbi:transcription termination/antitermination protein NusG [Armatimonas rosea]|jgi:transcription termination/antitermination protein NusG|uniref:Transcription termination/antitermination protein NusG n=1 Tax=Armatimonas rosea TaxID=685828 RepID=A0A7W9SL92_ARMRO|nr:transcription termination/antitermination protein NusG [Armatimonas rosea]MBB6048696.1 transcriptional antiterminator NusG [Armatimonas rosea]
MQRHWYAVHTYSGHEMKVKMTIEKRAETMGLRQKLFRILVPTDTETRNRGGKKTEYKRKVFPGYVLIDMVLDDDTWYLIKSTTGVTGFVSSGNKPVPLQDKEVRDILDALDPNNAASRPKKIWEKNQVVRVNSGPFADFTGKIEEVNDQKEKVKVMISLFGRDTPVELDFNQIEKI